MHLWKYACTIWLFSCDPQGNEIEPMTENDWDGLYVCAECGRVINQETLEVTGTKGVPALMRIPQKRQ